MSQRRISHTLSRAEFLGAQRRAVKTALKILPKHPDVVGVTTGYRLRRRKETREECLTVFVQTKIKPKSKVKKTRLVPRFFCGRNKDGSANRQVRVYTDVVQIQRVNPLHGLSGGSKLVVQGMEGTATLSFKDKHGGLQSLVVSNRHVLAPRVGAVGDRLINARVNGDLVEIGDLSEYFPLSIEGGKGFFDAALGKLNSGGESNARYLTIAEANDTDIPILGVRELRDNENGWFWLSGSNSGQQNGRLWDRLVGGGSWNIEYDHLGTFTVERLYGLQAYSRRGDSGSPIYEKTDEGATLVGIAVAVARDDLEDRTITLFHSITDVEKGFERLLGREFRFI